MGEGNGLGAEGGNKLPGPMILIGDKLLELVPGIHRVARGRAPRSRLQTPVSGLHRLQALGSRLRALRAAGSGLRGLRVPGSGLQASCSGLQARAPRFGLWAPRAGSRLWAPGSGLRALGSGLRAPGSGLPTPSSQAPGFAFRAPAPGSKLRALGSGLRAPRVEINSLGSLLLFKINSLSQGLEFRGWRGGKGEGRDTHSRSGGHPSRERGNGMGWALRVEINSLN